MKFIKQHKLLLIIFFVALLLRVGAASLAYTASGGEYDSFVENIKAAGPIEYLQERQNESSFVKDYARLFEI